MEVSIYPEQSLANKQHIAHIILPPDKSIFHRLLIIGSLTGSIVTIPVTAIEKIPVDIYATILALQSLGVPIELDRSEITMEGVGIGGYREPKHLIHCSNSGTTARLLMGVLAGGRYSSTLTGDSSLSVRPMKRLADLLNKELGADITTSVNGSMPVTIHGKELHSGNIVLPVASAQMKSAVILAGLHSQAEVSVTEPLQSRDHTERMLAFFGKGITKKGNVTSVSEYRFSAPKEFTYRLPGDISSAAFLIGAAVLLKKNIFLKNVGLNDTRARILPILGASGLSYEVSNITYDEGDEKRGDVEIFAAESRLHRPLVFFKDESALVVDEVPILSVLAAFCSGQTVFDNFGELRNKETDRLAALIKNLRACGVLVEELPGGFIVFGEEDFIPHAAIAEHFGDHRIAMAFAVMALRAKEKVTISDASVVSISYPDFFQDLAQVAGSKRIRIS